ncbi:hypothetical protein ILUMI_10309 [Ignelater luminosus]|uniref:Hydrophobin n=1 Tax=Ignelater luminosus TaxID=2038154 RepID=A0A8K0GDR6_IGNLU|nr:hypothetical protein ILUMI_10309 [Ignelater luminosus]
MNYYFLFLFALVLSTPVVKKDEPCISSGKKNGTCVSAHECMNFIVVSDIMKSAKEYRMSTTPPTEDTSILTCIRKSCGTNQVLVCCENFSRTVIVTNHNLPDTNVCGLPLIKVLRIFK